MARQKSFTFQPKAAKAASNSLTFMPPPLMKGNMINAPDFVPFCGVLHSALKAIGAACVAGGWGSPFGAQFRESAPKFQTRAGAAATPAKGKSGGERWQCDGRQAG